MVSLKDISVRCGVSVATVSKALNGHRVEKEERRVNAKSLLGILSLGIVGGTTIRIIADGPDEEAAVKGLVDLVDSGFAEGAR